MRGINDLGPIDPNDDAPFDVKFLKPLEFIKNNNDYSLKICVYIFIHRYILISPSPIPYIIFSLPPQNWKSLINIASVRSII